MATLSKLSGVLLLTGAVLTACASPPADDDSGAADSALTEDACPTAPLAPSWMKTETVDLDDGLHVRIGTMGTGSKGDVLFLEGFADRFDNHRPLFEQFVGEGLRVIAFDYPSQGETCGRSLDRYGFADLAELAGKVERLKAGSGPLYLSGWSTGGLLAVRIAQGIRPNALSRPLAGMALFAPGVDVRTVVAVSQETLTHNPTPPHVAPPKPSSPAFRPVFAAALVVNSKLSEAETLPPKVPTLVMTGGELEDRYVNTDGVIAWTEAQRDVGADTTGLQCAGGFHELDNEPAGIGDVVRGASAKFLASGGSAKPAASGSCKPF
jgi:alpha-beta hydrolase superfamily lysophospholipase